MFISNELLSPKQQQNMHLPMTFICYAITNGKMYQHFRNDGTFVVNYGKSWGNSVVYGAIFDVGDYDFYIRILDGYHQCSKSLLGHNHSKDVHHRIDTKASPIYFDSLLELEALKYMERQPIDVQMYTGNLNHPKIKQRLDKTISYRIVDGIDNNFANLFREENNE